MCCSMPKQSFGENSGNTNLSIAGVDKARFIVFRKGVSPKAYVIARLECVLGYFEAALHIFSDYNKETVQRIWLVC